MNRAVPFPSAVILAVACIACSASVAGAQEIADQRLQEATHLLDAGRVAASKRDFKSAIPLYEKALTIRESVFGPEHLVVATTLNDFAQLYSLMGDYPKALQLVERNLAIVQKALGPEHPGVATSLNTQAGLYQMMGDYAKALPSYQRSLAIVEKGVGPEHPDVATSLANLAGLYQTMGDYAKALPLVQRSLAIREKALGAEHPSVAISLNTLAGLYQSLGDYSKARPLYERSVAIREQALGPEHPSLATSLTNLAGLYQLMGEYEKALLLVERGLAIREKALGIEHPSVAISLNTLAGLHRLVGDYAKALPLVERSLAIREKALGVNHPSVATSLNTLAGLYHLMGDYAQALPLYERSLAIREKALGPEHPSVASSLNNLALLYGSMGEYPKALPLIERSLAIREKTLGPAHPSLAASLTNLAGLYQSMGDYAKALPLYQRSLAIRERALGPGHPDVAISLTNLAGVYERTGELERLVPLLNRALHIASEKNVPETLWRVQSGLSYALSRDGKPDLAIFFGKQAVNTIQGLRGRLASLEDSLQHAFLENKIGAYRAVAELLIDQGRLAEAQQVLSLLKEEEYFDFIRRDAGGDAKRGQTNLTGREPGWAKRYGEIAGDVARLGRRRDELVQKRKLGLAPEEEAELKRLDADAGIARRAFVAFLDELIQEAGRLDARRQKELAQRNVEGLENYQDDLKALGRGTVMLHYVVLLDKVRIILTTPEIQLSRSYAIELKTLNREIEAFRRVLQNPKSHVVPAAQSLYRALIAPVAQDLRQAGARTLILSLDGPLRYIPFGALSDGKRYLVENYRLVRYTAAAGGRLPSEPSHTSRIAALGLTHEVPGFAPLPAVRQEVDAILKVATVKGEMYLDDDFTAERVREAASNRERTLLHVASHFVFRPGTETDSFLLLGDGGRLTLRELREAGYNFRSVDLLSLSACETAVGGGADASGREVEGLGVLAQQRGARAVMATLWPVADTSTAEFMRRFYELKLNATGTDKAEALRQAQLAFIGGARAGSDTDAKGEEETATPDASTVQSASRYAHPFFWAPFILMGNWL